jgi:hypothetical protein
MRTDPLSGNIALRILGGSVVVVKAADHRRKITAVLWNSRANNPFY